MSKEAIIEQIIKDAQAESEAIIANAEARADQILAEATAECESEKAAIRREAEARAKAIQDGKEATARLDSQKILLREKRRVIDKIYSLAFERLFRLSKHDTLSLTERLLNDYAEAGEEIIFSSLYAYASEAAELPVIKQKKLKVCSERAEIEGGFLLRSEICDRDFSYRALLEKDREENQSDLARRLFQTR